MDFHMDADTRMGGENARFPETRHSAILAARSDNSEQRIEGNQAVISAYWKPVYRYIRAKWHRSNDDAKDLTQGFFTMALEKRAFDGYAPEKGTFRTYLRTCLDRYLANDRKFASRLKRSAPMVAVDFESLESPEAFFEREWARNLFEVAVERLRFGLRERGRNVCFTVFERYDLAEEPLSYDELARELGISVMTVTNYLAAARRELRRLVLEELRAITPDEHEFRREARVLLR